MLSSVVRNDSRIFRGERVPPLSHMTTGSELVNKPDSCCIYGASYVLLDKLERRDTDAQRPSLFMLTVFSDEMERLLCL